MTAFRPERLLVRTFFGRFFESELMPPGLPQLQVVIWGVALFAGPAYLLSFVFAIKYGGVPAARLVVSTQADALFFVTYGMMATGIVALFTWDSLFPDRRDVRILGPLPLRTRTHVLGRLGAVGAVAALFCIGINLLPAVFYGLTLWGNNMAAGPVRAVAGHFIATVMGGVFMFFMVMAAQGVLLNVLGRGGAHRCALTLQPVFVLVLLLSVVLVPDLASGVRDAFAGEGSAMVRFLPPAWFLSLYDVIAGAPRAAPLGYAFTAVIATIVTVASATALLAGSYGRLVRMAIETPGDGGHAGHRVIQRTLRIVVRLVTTHPVERAVSAFTLCTLTRSRSHLILFATCLGVGGALALPGLVRAVSDSGTAAFGRPSVTMLSVPLVFNFVALCGFRLLLAIPTDIKANWVFRLHARADLVLPAIAGVRTALLLSVVTPIAVTAGMLGTGLWGPSAGLRHGLFTGLLGLLLVEALLISLRKIPFTCTYSPGLSGARTSWLFYVLGFSAYAYWLAALELSILTHSFRFSLTVVVMAVGIMTLEYLRRRSLRGSPGFTYEDEDPDAVFRGFRLSEGLAAESRAPRAAAVGLVIEAVSAPSPARGLRTDGRSSSGPPGCS